ncbi:septum formation protein Maf [Pacificimonas flava]|uniref:dTTP/UTP pyrophosphatase n=2 Tax=Pacificimonas TaxID=1960290 RepID=A0A219B2S5_9SPHN|nr:MULTISPECIES: nucleoside triphosphate pyrophosphatase [Pacificimonas]MBZ6377669.1 septum formation protein Maf [Pacificimonas aurantium]OWV32650.1 septum formation protein Maf [Pacificimonas flava]
MTEVAQPPLVLASSSPRRRDLLAQIGILPARTQSPDIDETPRPAEPPRVYAERMAREKALAVPREAGECLLAGDTTVAAGRRIFPPAASEEDVARFLELLSGRRHRVFAAVALIDAEGVLRARVAESVVRFKRLHPDEIAAYAASGEGIGKAAGYAIQGRAAGLIAFMSGSYSGVVGLPLFETRALLETAGLHV